MSESKRSVIRPNALLLVIVIGAAILGLGWYVARMYRLEQGVQELIERQESTRDARESAILEDPSN
jgi:hypothetical protein